MSKYAPRYFKIDWDVASNDWRYLLTIHDSDTPIRQDNILFSIGSTYKLTSEVVSTIATYPFLGVQGVISTERFAFCYTPVYISKEIVEALGISMKVGFYSFEDIIENMPIFINLIKGTQVNLSMEGITEITEEDYYKID